MSFLDDDSNRNKTSLPFLRWRRRLLSLLIFVAGTCSGASAYATTFAELTAWLDQPPQALPPCSQGVYGHAELSKLEPCLVPGLTELMAFDDLQLEIASPNSYPVADEYLAATAAHQSSVVLDEDGTMRGYVAGQPFSARAIASAAPERAGSMLAWNQKFRWQYVGYRSEVVISLIRASESGIVTDAPLGIRGSGQVERHMRVNYQRAILSHLAHLPEEEYRLDLDDARELHWKEYVEFLDPFDVRGTRFVVERPLQALLEDQVYSYLPTERRVRRLSAKERADGWMGSNMSLDDFESYAGRVLDHKWRYMGQASVLSVINSKHTAAKLVGPMSSVPSDRWEVRKAYVVENTPKWSGHPYQRRVLFLDAETFVVLYSLVFDHSSELWKIFVNLHRTGDQKAPRDLENTVPQWMASLAIDVENGTNSVFRASRPASYTAVSTSRLRRTFDVSNLTEGR